MSDPIIRVQGLTKRFGDFTAVDDLSIAVEPGEVFAFLGANGSGKSTTIRMLIGLLTPSAGSIQVGGIDVIAHPRRVRDRIGYMGQRVSLYQGLTLLENVEFYAGLYAIGGRDLEARWGSVRERFDLAEAEEEKPENLPAGLRQRAGLALATLHRPHLLFLDEPTAGVDVHSRALFWERIQEEAATGVTVFVTTHFMEETDYCDRVSFIDAGRLVADATAEELRDRYSEGYRLQVPAPPGDAARSCTRLEEAGFRVTADGERWRLRIGALSPESLGTLAVVLGSAAVGQVRIEQPPMNAVFATLMRIQVRERSAAAAPGAAPVPAEATS